MWISRVPYILHSTQQWNSGSRLNYCWLVSYFDLSRSSTLSSLTWLVRYPRQLIVFLSDAKFKFSFVHFPFEYFSFKSSWWRTSILFFFFLRFIYLTTTGLDCACRFFSCGMQLLGCSMWYLVPWPAIELLPPALRTWSLSHWTTREVSGPAFLKFCLNPIDSLKRWFPLLSEGPPLLLE